MKKTNFIQNTLIIVLGAFIIVMSVGYAVYGNAVELSYARPTEVVTWDVHFENITTSLNTTVDDLERITPAISNSIDTFLSFNVNLKPGEIYELVSTVRNGGKQNGILKSVSLTASNIDGTPCTNENIRLMLFYKDGSEIKIGDYLDAGFKRDIVVRVVYEEYGGTEFPIDEYIIKLNMNYEQV